MASIGTPPRRAELEPDTVSGIHEQSSLASISPYARSEVSPIGDGGFRRGIWVGTASWTDHDNFYPPGVPAGERLGHYARFFPFVEVDYSFYRMFSAAQFARSVERTPREFRMAVKAYRGLSLHLKDEPPSETMAGAHLEATSPLVDAGKFATFVVQFPPWIRKSPKLAAYLRELRTWFGDASVAIEFRHESWFDTDALADTLSLLRELPFVNVILEEPDPQRTGLIPTVAEVTASDAVYYRFQGRDQLKGKVTNQERHEYGSEEISELAALVTRLHATGNADSFVVMHNNYSNNAVKAGMEMMLVLRDRGAPVQLAQERSPGIQRRWEGYRNDCHRLEAGWNYQYLQLARRLM